MQSHIDKEPSGFVHLLVSFYTYPSGAEGQLKRVLADVNDFVEFDSQIKSHTLEFRWFFFVESILGRMA